MKEKKLNLVIKSDWWLITYCYVVFHLKAKLISIKLQLLRFLHKQDDLRMLKYQ